MDNTPVGLEHADDRRLTVGDLEHVDEDDDWVSDFDDDIDQLDRFDLGIYAGALK